MKVLRKNDYLVKVRKNEDNLFAKRRDKYSPLIMFYVSEDKISLSAYRR